MQAALQDQWIYVDEHSRGSWDSWESVRVIQVLERALIHIGMGSDEKRLPPNTVLPNSQAGGARGLLRQVWRQVDMATFRFPSQSCH